jgi:hypothetical protein
MLCVWHLIDCDAELRRVSLWNLFDCRYVKAGAAQDVGLSAGVVEETQARWEGFKGHVQDVMASVGTQGEKAIAAAVDKKRFHTVFAAAENEVRGS